jgi:anti-sigma regulatory factor (Ser/Thr protein kinase)
MLDPLPVAAPLNGTWGAVPGSIADARRQLAAYAGNAGASQRTRDAVALAVSETVANAVVHAFPEGTEPGTIVIAAQLLEGGRMAVVVGDDGCGMPMDESRSGLGLGLALIAQLTERVEIMSDPDDGTSITMVFVLET